MKIWAETLFCVLHAEKNMVPFNFTLTALQLMDTRSISSGSEKSRDSPLALRPPFPCLRSVAVSRLLTWSGLLLPPSCA